DECLNTILKQKELKLIAVAGTHGKTSTTALVVWLFMQLQTPISYSVGAKLSFGPMGLFDPSSNYFVYECDEFDHNFLSFYPEISIITSVDWDHHDIYPTRQEYKKAFRHFIVQSTQTYIFDKDNSYLELDKESKIHVLQSTAKSLDKLQIPGLHNRQNSYIASKAVAAILGKNLEEVMHLANNFPGTSRRLERLASNIYSDYAHTPEEIAATLQLASEISKNVVVVYEPLTNRRQHYMKNQYKAAFSGVKKLYWLPSYLAREDPNLEILSPQELISYLDNPEIARAMKKNDELKNVILNHAKNGDMVICMAGGGGNSLDEWVRKTVV
ncbi:MAG TPA: Mur ligase family protein, partial [Candidatus Saccharibacteria bacterium]|nr:Mur ligase family protein [Candidatus Saccharibacteria bacterium]